MPVANFRFYAELNDFLVPERRFTEFAYGFLDVATVKDRALPTRREILRSCRGASLRANRALG
jgi:hypothetical protein